jgi:hypothetical protein
MTEPTLHDVLDELKKQTNLLAASDTIRRTAQIILNKPGRNELTPSNVAGSRSSAESAPDPAHYGRAATQARAPGWFFARFTKKGRANTAGNRIAGRGMSRADSGTKKAGVNGSLNRFKEASAKPTEARLAAARRLKERDGNLARIFAKGDVSELMRKMHTATAQHSDADRGRKPVKEPREHEPSNATGSGLTDLNNAITEIANRANAVCDLFKQLPGSAGLLGQEPDAEERGWEVLAEVLRAEERRLDADVAELMALARAAGSRELSDRIAL